MRWISSQTFEGLKMLLPLSQRVVAANVILLVLASTAVTLRVLARRKQRQPLKADDFLIVAALVRE